MRRRRRQSTQIIKKINHSSTSLPSYPSLRSSGIRWKRVVVWMFSIIVLGSLSYFLYTWSPEPAGQEILTEDSTELILDEPEITESDPAPFEENIQVEILNGCGFNGVAKIFQSYLREQGFDVVNTDNYLEDGKRRWDIQKSMVIDRVGEFEQAISVARALGITGDQVFSKENPEAIYDVSVVIGKDFKQLKGSN